MSPALAEALARMDRGQVAREPSRFEMLARIHDDTLVGGGLSCAFWSAFRTVAQARRKMEARAVGLRVPCWSCGHPYTRALKGQRNCGACIAKKRRPSARRDS